MGDLFFRPSHAIVSCTLPKCAGRLIPGVFLDYYTPRGGELSGQFIVVPLVDFVGKPLHITTPKSAYKLRLNRTEVVRRKANCVMPIFPLKARYNKANYSLDGHGGEAVETSAVPDFSDIPDDAEDTSITEDVVYDAYIYDYVLPASKEVDALCITPAGGRGGVEVKRMHPTKYMWDHLPEFHGYLTEIFPADLRGSVPSPAAFSPTEVVDRDVPVEADPALDVAESPFPDMIGVGEPEDRSSAPESVTEIEILRKLLTIDFNHASWTGHETTHWQQNNAYYIVYKANSNINMPSINGRGGSPH